MELKSILPKTAPRSQALIRVYNNYCRLNAAAAQRLGIKEGDCVDIFCDKRQMEAGRTRIYIGKSSSGIAAKSDRKSIIINSRPLAHRLVEILGKEGAYRVCPEDSVELGSNRFFNIFFKAYDKENTAKGYQPQSV